MHGFGVSKGGMAITILGAQFGFCRVGGHTETGMQGPHISDWRQVSGRTCGQQV